MRSRWKYNKLMVTGGILALAFVVVALVAPVLSPYDPNEVKLEARLLTPGREHPMGTDGFGRDVLSRVMYGARYSLALALLVVVVEFLLGLFIGAAAGYYGGWLDEVVMRLVDMLLAFPKVILAICVVGVLGPSIPNLLLALVALGWVGYARMARGVALAIKEEPYVAAARVLGAGDAYVLVRHVIPNVFPPLAVLATLHVGHTMLAIAALGFLGLGVQPPTPEWGTMLSDGKQFVFTHPHVMLFPGLAIVLCALAFNLIAEGLRDALDPRWTAVLKL